MDLSHGETGVPEHGRHSAGASRVSLDPGEGNGARSSPPAWKVPWMREPGGLQSMGSQRVRHD